MQHLLNLMFKTFHPGFCVKHRMTIFKNYSMLKKKHKKNLDLLAVFFISFTAFFITQLSIKYLAGNDSFLYAKLAEITDQQGFLKEFPWLNATIMQENFTGLHFLFYGLLTFFTCLGNLFLAAKTGISFFFAVMNTVFYFLLKRFNLKYPFLWWLLFLAASPMFLYRMSFIKPFSLSIALILLAFYALVKNKNLLLLIISFLAVWAHPSFVLIPIIAFLHLTIRIFNPTPTFSQERTSRIPLLGGIRNRFPLFQPLFYSLTGIILGLTVNPFFPNNLNLISVYSDGPSFYSIAEWQPVAMTKIIGDAPILIFLFAFFASCYFVSLLLKNNHRWLYSGDNHGETEHKSVSRFYSLDRTTKPTDKNIPILLSFPIALAMLILTAMCNRFIDYYVPFMVLFVALAGEHCLKNYINKKGFRAHLPLVKIARGFNKSKRINTNYVSPLLLLVVSSILIAISINNFCQVSRMANDSAAETEKIGGAAEWLKENTPLHSIVFNANWGDFPKLFFYNTHNYYVAGLDPKFLYRRSPQKYWLYEHLAKGEICAQKTCPASKSFDKMYNIIKYQFQANYIFISDISEYPELVGILESGRRFKKVYKKGEAEIWKLGK